MAWAFTRLSVQGVWRYPDNVSEVIAHVFFVHFQQKNNQYINDYGK